MRSRQSESITITIIGLSMFLLLLFNVLGLMTFEPYREYGRVTDHWTLYLSLIVLVALSAYYRAFLPKFNYIYISLLLFLGTHTLSTWINDEQVLTETYIHFGLMLVFILTMMTLRWNRDHTTFFGLIASIIILAYTYHWVDEGFVTGRYLGFFTNSNISGIFFFTLLFFQLISLQFNSRLFRYFIILSIIANCILIYVTTARTLLLCLAVILGSYFVLKKSKKLYYYLFHLIMAFNLSFVFIYILLYNSPFAEGLDNLSAELFNKSFFSGRQVIWDPAIKYGLESPLFGHGVGTGLADFMGDTHYVHTHNQYLQTFLDGGIIGLVILSLFLFIIWKLYNQHLESYVVQLSSCFFLGILVYQNTDMSLFHNLPSISLLHWLIIAIGVSYSIYLPIKNNDEIR